MTRAAIAAALASGLLGCAVDASLEGKGCPCADGWDCDRARNVCERATCDPQVRVSSLAPSWATAHSIRWQWEASGVEEDFLRYELWLAENEADLLARSGTAWLVDGAENPDIAYWNMPVTGDPVTSAITRGLQAGGVGAPEYWAQLVAVDVHGCASESNTVARHTGPEGLNGIRLFEDRLRPGSELLPAVLQLVGSELEYRAIDDNDEDGCQANENDAKATCGQPLKVSGFVLELAEDPVQPTLARVTAGGFPDAYLSARVRLDAPIPAVFAGLWLTVGACVSGDGTAQAKSGPFVIGNGGAWIDLEVPLAALELESTGALLSYDHLYVAAGGRPVCGFALEGQWHKTAVVHIDDVVVRF